MSFRRYNCQELENCQLNTSWVSILGLHTRLFKPEQLFIVALWISTGTSRALPPLPCAQSYPIPNTSKRSQGLRLVVCILRGETGRVQS